MKKTLLKFLLFLMPIFCFSNQYFVEIEDNEDSFDIKIREFENRKNTRLILEDLYIELPERRYGIISLDVDQSHYVRRTNKSNFYDESIFTFYKELHFIEGDYLLYINDEYYGSIHITEDEIYFDPINCL